LIRLCIAGIALAVAVPALSQDKIQSCLACHGPSGTSSTPLTPSLGGQPSFFLVAQLFLFREGRRDNAVMTAAAKGLTDADLRRLSDTISKLPAPAPPAGPADPSRMKLGLELIQARHCTSCHGMDFAGHNNVPRVAGQREDYLLKTLRDYRSGTRIGYGNAVMPETVAGLDEAQLADLAYFLARVR
jgi:cytochrome c553